MYYHKNYCFYLDTKEKSTNRTPLLRQFYQYKSLLTSTKDKVPFNIAHVSKSSVENYSIVFSKINDPEVFNESMMNYSWSKKLDPSELSTDYMCEKYEERGEESIDLAVLNLDFLTLKTSNELKKNQLHFVFPDIEPLSPLVPAQTMDFDYTSTFDYNAKDGAFKTTNMRTYDGLKRGVLRQVLNYLLQVPNSMDVADIWNLLGIYRLDQVLIYKLNLDFHMNIYSKTYNSPLYIATYLKSLPNLLLEFILSKVKRRNCSIFSEMPRSSSVLPIFVHHNLGGYLNKVINLANAEQTSVADQFIVGSVVQQLFVLVPSAYFLMNFLLLKNKYEADLNKFIFDMASLSIVLVINVILGVYFIYIMFKFFNIHIIGKYSSTSFLSVPKKLDDEDYRKLMGDMLNNNSISNPWSLESVMYNIFTVYNVGQYAGFIFFLCIMIYTFQNLLFLTKVDYNMKYDDVLWRMIYGDRAYNYYMKKQNDTEQKEEQEKFEISRFNLKDAHLHLRSNKYHQSQRGVELNLPESQPLLDRFKSTKSAKSASQSLKLKLSDNKDYKFNSPYGRNSMSTWNREDNEPIIEGLLRLNINNFNQAEPKIIDIVRKLFVYGVPGLFFIVVYDFGIRYLRMIISFTKFQGVGGYYSTDQDFHEAYKNHLKDHEFFKPSKTDKYYLHNYYYRHVNEEPGQNLTVNTIFYDWIRGKWTDWKLMQHYGLALWNVICLVISVFGLYSWINVTDLNENILQVNGLNLKDFRNYFKNLNKYFDNLQMDYELAKKNKHNKYKKELVPYDEDTLIKKTK